MNMIDDDEGMYDGASGLGPELQCPLKVKDIFY